MHPNCAIGVRDALPRHQCTNRARSKAATSRCRSFRAATPATREMRRLPGRRLKMTHSINRPPEQLHRQMVAIVPFLRDAQIAVVDQPQHPFVPVYAGIGPLLQMACRDSQRHPVVVGFLG